MRTTAPAAVAAASLALAVGHTILDALSCLARETFAAGFRVAPLEATLAYVGAGLSTGGPVGALFQPDYSASGVGHAIRGALALVAELAVRALAATPAAAVSAADPALADGGAIACALEVGSANRLVRDALTAASSAAVVPAFFAEAHRGALVGFRFGLFPD